MKNSPNSAVTMAWEPISLDYMQAYNEIVQLPDLNLFEDSDSVPSRPTSFIMPPRGKSLSPPDTGNFNNFSSCITPDSSSVSVSSVFFPGSHEPPSDRIMRSLDSVLFYVNSQVILKKLPQAFQAFLGMPLDDQQFEETIVNIPETSSVLNVILQAIYRLSCTKHSPTFDHLLLAVRRMPLYGLQPKNYIFDSESSSSSLFDMLLSHAPLCPIQVYTLAAQFNIDELAVKCSSHLLSYRLSELTDELVTTMGAVYLRRLMVLHTSLIDTLKRVLLQPPPPHSAIQNCGFEDQKKLSRAWALTSSYLAWDSRPDLPIHQLQNTFLALGDHLQCEKCKEVLKLRVKEVVVRWVNVKRTI